MSQETFAEWFKKATGPAPFPFQRKFAEEPVLPQLVHIPTGLGKTAMAIVGWLWRRFGAGGEYKSATPRRLVYCLPMRVLVEQTRDNAAEWVEKLCKAGLIQFDVPIHVLMGGEDEDIWDINPEGDAIIIGTQDMLLSRALNRGYAASRARWPMQFGLLHTDCLWVFDEIQLMGSGLATTSQLEGFRHPLGSNDGHGCRSVWMSATMQRDWLKTVDFRDRVDALPCLKLGTEDHKHDEVKQRWEAKKPLKKADAKMSDVGALAKEILDKHKSGTRTIVVVNTVKRACDLHHKITKKWGSGSDQRLVLLHSRFRPEDRKARFAEAMADPTGNGTIIVSTQVIEAGVDVSATTLFTEPAPWASLVQRFGRCNRRGEENDSAGVRWIDLPANERDAAKSAAPYELDDLKAAAEELQKLQDVGPKSLPDVELGFEHTHVIRRKDLIDLFDTTPDLAGNDIDIDRFVREVEDSAVRVFWRVWNQSNGPEPPPEDEPAPRRKELCPAPIGEFRKFVPKHSGKVWRWNFLEGGWEKVDAAKIAPGQVFLIHASAGGYSAERGWDQKRTKPVSPIAPPSDTEAARPEATDDDRPSRAGVWQTVGEHTDEVLKELDAILTTLHLAGEEREALLEAARRHDHGKAHEVFRAALPDESPDEAKTWGKAKGTWKPYGRPHFRHELASALAVLMSSDDLVPADHRDLIAYLVAAHHGKVRLSIRSLPNEIRPDKGRRFARGIWDGDTLPATDLGGGVTAPAVTLSLEPMELGLCEHSPFAGQPSWAERMIGLRDRLGPFRLAYLEALLRAADMRASRAAEQREPERPSTKMPTAGKEAARG